MRYFIRHEKDAKVEGPFTVEALTAAIWSGRLPSNALASGDLGEDINSLQVWRSCDWFPLAAIAELRGVVPPVPELPAKPQHVSLFTVFVFVAMALSFSYQAITEQRWFESLLAVFMVYSAVHMIIHFVRHRATRSPAS